MHDYTAASVIEVWHEPAPHWGRGNVQDMLPLRQTVVQAFRLARGLEYTLICNYVAAIMRDPAFQGDVSLVVDTSGVGAAVASIMREHGARFTSVNITAGEALREVDHMAYRVGKSYLVTSLAAAIESNELKISSACHDAKALKDQLYDFKVSISEKGNVQFGAHVGRHDDLVLATGLAWIGASITGGFGFRTEPIAWRR